MRKHFVQSPFFMCAKKLLHMIYVRRLMDRNLEGAIDSEEVRPAEI